MSSCYTLRHLATSTDTTLATMDQPNLDSAEVPASPNPPTPPTPPTPSLADSPAVPGPAVSMPPGPKAPAPSGVPSTPGRYRWLWGTLSLLLVTSLLLREASVMFPSVAINVKPFNLTWIEGSAVLPSDPARCPNNTLRVPTNYQHSGLLRLDGGLQGIIAWAGYLKIDVANMVAAANAANKTSNLLPGFPIIAPRLSELQEQGNLLLTLTRRATMSS